MAVGLERNKGREGTKEWNEEGHGGGEEEEEAEAAAGGGAAAAGAGVDPPETNESIIITP